ncbi:MAG: phospholipid carrier-dependent glycosyltransferase [Propionibacteriaceae bacterium]|nr:phospholipid carrier-dependent glycosyltransferase [Propionibacteriaceae bacterium]
MAGWVVTVAITALAFVIRFVNLGVPNKLVFDETYYAKDGFTLWKFGYETKWPEDANDSIAAGISDIFLTDPSYIVHPPVGKWLIGFGEQLFGMNAFGWRFMPMVFGTLLVFLVIRFARRLSRSTLVGAIAGLLLTFDGLAFLMSRMALLDIFQSVFLVAGVSCVLADRDYYRLKLAAKLEQLNLPDFGEAYGAILIWRPWRLAAGLLFGLAIGTKWNSLYVLAVMGILSVVWDVKARKLAGAGWRSGYALLTDGLPAFCYLVVVAAGVYLASWSGWLSTAGGYYRDWGAQHPDDPTVKALGVDWAALLHYHIEVFNFHTGDYMREQSHPYNAHPSGWLLMVRPTGIDWVSDVAPGVNGCVAPEGETCVQVLNGMGTPFLWWLAALALVVGLVWWIGGRDWRFGLPILAAMSTYIPWFFNADRPVFFFYSITILPFTVTLLAMVLGLALGPTSGRWRRRRGIIVGVLVGLIVANFAWIYPVLTGKTILRSEWMARMWLAFWI